MKGYREPRGKAKDGTPRWRLRVYVGRDEDGKQDTISETFLGSKRDADLRLEELVVEARRTPASARTQRTLEACWEEWQRIVAPNRSPGTVRGYAGIFERDLAPLARKPLAKIDTPALNRLYRALLDAGMTPNRLEKVHSFVRTLLSFARKQRWIVTNPALDTERPVVVRERIRAPKEDEVQRLVAVVAGDEELRTLILLAAATGCRRGELAALRFGDFDLEQGVVLIARSLAIGKDRLIEKDTKTHAQRELELDPETIALVRAHHRRLRKRALSFGVALEANGFVFSDDVACRLPLHPDTISHRYARACRRAGVRTGLHGLRRFHATTALHHGADLAAVRDRLGHKMIETTGLYVTGTKEADRGIATSVGRALYVV